MSGAAARMPQQAVWGRGAIGSSHGEKGYSSGGGYDSGGIDPTKKKGTARVPESSLAFYRRYTELLLRRYMQVSLRMGRVPSVLGSCMFRGRVSSRRVESFEDAVAFVLDIERCMKQLTPEAKELVARIALQEYTQEEAAELTGQGLRTVVRKYGEAIDMLTKIFLEKELLEIGPVFG